MLDLKDKLIILAATVLTAGTLVFIIYNQHQLSVQNQAIQTQVIATQQLADNISRAQSTWASKADLTNFAKQNDINLQPVLDNLKTLNASLTAINQATANSTGQHATGIGSTGTTPTSPEPVVSVECNGKQIPCPNPDTFGYLAKRQELALNEDFAAPAGTSAVAVPLGTVGFSANQQKPWDINILPRDYNLITTLGTKDDGTGQQVAFNQLTIKVNGKNYAVPISKNQFLQQFPTAKFSWFNPRLFLGVSGGLDVTSLKGEFSPDVSLGIMSYGKSLTSPDFSILQVGIGYNVVAQKPQVSIMPFSYNVGQMAKPLINNLYLGPVLDIGINGDITVGAGFRVGL